MLCSAAPPVRGSFPETLDLKSAWYDPTAAEMLAAFVSRTLTAHPPGATPPEDVFRSGLSSSFFWCSILCGAMFVFLCNS